MKIVLCVSCEGFGWFEDVVGETEECEWCGGIGYTYQDNQEIDHRIPPEDYERVSGQLEKLESERMRTMGYTGEAKKPWEQKIRQHKDDGQHDS